MTVLGRTSVAGASRVASVFLLLAFTVNVASREPSLPESYSVADHAVRSTNPVFTGE